MISPDLGVARSEGEDGSDGRGSQVVSRTRRTRVRRSGGEAVLSEQALLARTVSGREKGSL